MSVIILVSGSKVTASSPYNPELPSSAKALGGRWDAAARVWTFDARDEQRVRELYRTVYGTDGTASDVVTIRATAAALARATSGQWRATTVFLAGREVAHVRGRDSGATLGEGVVVVEGWVSSGGSVKNPRVDWGKSTVLEIRDVPRGLAEALAADAESGVAIVEASAAADDSARRAELEGEAARLRARLAEIESELARLA